LGNWCPPEWAIEAIVTGRHDDPFAVLGPHGGETGRIGLAAFLPDVETVEAVDRQSGEALGRFSRLHREGFFFATIPGTTSTPYRLRLTRGAASWEIEDPYRFPSRLGDLDRYLIAEGSHRRLYERLGAHPTEIEGVPGVSFAVWAPNARRVSVVGLFNAWDGRRHPMRKHPGIGVWELFIPGLGEALYKYELLAGDGTLLPLKADPFAFAQETPPGTASRVHGLPSHGWSDQEWMGQRQQAQARSAPISIYEVHLGSWRRGEHNMFMGYDRLADELIAYVKDLGFTHIELLPISEHPFTGSWGYQPIGLFAPTARFGGADQFADFVDRFHRAGIGVLLDWVPAHFPNDAHGLARFDGTALYEHEDPRAAPA
jgi:1,4-alpha-glucan branching enzyme